jgi:hypothetical protein
MRLAFYLLIASLLPACGKARSVVVYEDPARVRAHAAIEERKAEQLKVDRENGEGSAACSKLANDTRACEALKPAQREGAAVCAAMDVDLFQKCARYKSSMGER